TDIDIFDANKKNKNEVELTHEECIQGGAFFELHTWLDEVIDKNQSFGFYRPYANDLGGVSVEKWHLSFFPISSKADELYTLDVFKKNLELAEMEFKEIIVSKIEYYFENYIKNITRLSI